MIYLRTFVDIRVERVQWWWLWLEMTGCVGWPAGWGWAVLAPADWLSYWSSVAGTVQCQHQPASASTLHPSHRLDQDTPHPPLILSFCHGRQVLHLDFVVFRFKNIDPSLNIWDCFFVGSQLCSWISLSASLLKHNTNGKHERIKYALKDCFKYFLSTIFH